MSIAASKAGLSTFPPHRASAHGARFPALDTSPQMPSHSCNCGRLSLQRPPGCLDDRGQVHRGFFPALREKYDSVVIVPFADAAFFLDSLAALRRVVGGADFENRFWDILSLQLRWTVTGEDAPFMKNRCGIT